MIHTCERGFNNIILLSINFFISKYSSLDSLKYSSQQIFIKYEQILYISLIIYYILYVFIILFYVFFFSNINYWYNKFMT